MYLLVLYFFKNTCQYLSSKQRKFIYSIILNSSTIRLFRVYVCIYCIFYTDMPEKGGRGACSPHPDVWTVRCLCHNEKKTLSIFPLFTTVGKSRYLPQGLNYWKPKRLNFVMTLDSCPPTKALKKRGFNNFDDNIQHIKNDYSLTFG